MWPDTVKRGDMIRQVRGSTGTLDPREDSIQLIPALTDATVVHIRVLPGTMVKPDTILMDLAAPEVEQKLLDAKLQVKQAESDYKALQAQLQSTLMDKKILAAQVNADYTQDQLQAQTDKQLYELGVISGMAANKSQEHGRPACRAAQAQPAAARCERKEHRSAARILAGQDRPGEDITGSLSEADGRTRRCGRGLPASLIRWRSPCRWART